MKYYSKQIAIICFLLSAVLTGCGNSSPSSVSATRYVSIQSVSQSTDSNVLTVSGNVTPTETVKLSFKLSGIIENLPLNEGDIVNKGDPVATLDVSDYSLALNSAKSASLMASAQISASQDQQQAAQANYDAAKLQLDKELPSKIAQAKAQLDLTQTTYNRTKTLYDKGIVSKSQLDEISAKLKSDSETYNQALDAVETTKAKLEASKKSIDAYSAQVSADEAQLQKTDAATQKAENDLNDTKLTSPINGVVLSKIMNTDEVTSAGTPVVALGSIDNVYIEIGVPDTKIGFISKGEPAKISVYGQDKVYDGIVEEIGSVADSTTRTFTVKIRVSNKNHNLRPGMIAKSEIKLNSGKAVLVPLDSVIQKASGPIVFIYDDSTKKV
ncbi:MAG: efflux RND transporter periplasmic adaptor subunit [Clostridia bacterium]|jgi:multidrug efflux pump subunit AcrA (membrane-fusion protein)|nr:efflux RND transporter periplasmic adaptor subunit [Clostridia bacterium]MCI2000547.1 efflux RND transporter periplasmic adaptor subunit [Clostridia bacterium]MCI2015002.1 efflux RND transporter periplasmic adaptor subunit [Clostridia bacterium]